ncbi:MAG TPA: hypothetical protein VNU46_01165, partial [Gemmatimonadaceae bacterium]|nr:hypothetical protein [Gemmatimonadaceae bacterium]
MACVTVGLLLSVAVTTGAMAQDSSHVHIASGQTYGVALAVIQVRPAGIVVNPKTHTATVQFINNSYDTVHAEITMQDTLPRNSGA